MKATNATNHLRTFRSEVAPGIYLVTDAEATVDFHDDGEPCGGGKYLWFCFEDNDGVKLPITSWPWMSRYMRDVALGREDPHRSEFEAWIEELEVAAELANTKGTEAPATSHGRDNREAESC